MGIQTLPSSTVRAIGASQVLNDPASVIKELLDNALDARASSIAIEISSNTLDTIQVRDNGHGIPPEDRHLVARPHCTSKISCENDLREIGGMSLGFRGEALASVAELSGSLTITTRVEGEQVAIALKINQQGDLIGQDRASLPVGTTLKITDFIKANPVRRQVALRDTEKCLKKIKLILQSYAFARPHVRLSLKVLKAKSDKGNWTYAPQAGGNAEDAAFKIVGAACASQCIWSIVEEHGFALQAFLPRVGAAIDKINHFGSFLSVDGRPVSAARGTPKQIVKSFREAVKKADVHLDGVKDPFIYLEIGCPQASYDANVEPAKDDVLFENPDIVVSAARRLFATVYSPPGPATHEDRTLDSALSRETRVEPQSEEDEFTTSLEPSTLSRTEAQSLAQDRSASILDSPSDPLITNDTEKPNHVRENHQRSFRPNMYGCDEEDLNLLDARPPTDCTEADFGELRQARKDVNLSNPWMMAKMNASVKFPAETLQSHQVAAPGVMSSNAPARESSRINRPLVELEASGLPTPRPSSPSQPSQELDLSKRVLDKRLIRDSRMIGSQSLPAPQAPMLPATSFSSIVGDDIPTQSPGRQPQAYDYMLSSHAPEPSMGTPLHAIPDASLKPRRNPKKPMQQTHINKPFVQPVHDQLPRERVWFDHLEENGQRRQGSPRKRPYQQEDIDGLVVRGELGDLAEGPHPLTPPRRNRDMRDFVTPANRIINGSTASSINSRNFPKQKGAHPEWTTGAFSAEQDEENVAPTSGVLNDRGFTSASELAALQGHVDPISKSSSRPSKRLKSSNGQAMREINGNAVATEENDDDEYRPVQSSRKASRRPTTDGIESRRYKSSRLPLERVPAGQGVHHVVFNISTTVNEVSRLARKMDENRSLLGWNEPVLGASDAFAAPPSPPFMGDLAAKLREVLMNSVSDGEIVQDLHILVQNAFATHERVTTVVEVI